MRESGNSLLATTLAAAAAVPYHKKMTIRLSDVPQQNSP